MNPKAEFQAKDDVKERPRRNLIMLGIIAPLAGLGAGLVGALFRLALEKANWLRDALIIRLDGWGIGGFVLFVGLASGAAAIAVWLVRRIAPSAAGSGIPRVMAVLDGEVPPAPPLVTPIKFLAGTLAIGSGLALGREGPTVQMGASIAYQTGTRVKVWTLRQRLFRSAAKTDRMCIDFFTHSDQSGLKKGQSLERISRWRAAFGSQSLDFFKSLAFKIGGEAMDRQFFRHTD